MRVARADQDVQIVPHIQAYAPRQPLIVEVVVRKVLAVVGVPVGTGHFMAGEGVDRRRQAVVVLPALAHIQLLAAVAVGHEGFVLLAQRLEGAIQVGLEGQLVAGMVVTLDVVHRQRAGGADATAHGTGTRQRGVLGHRMGLPVVQLGIEVPVVVQVVVQLDEGVPLAIAALVPVHAQELVSGQVGIGVVVGHRQAVGVRCVVRVVHQSAHGEARAIAQRLVGHAIEQRIPAIDVVLEGPVLFQHRHEARPQVPVFIQRAGHVARGTHGAEAVHHQAGFDQGRAGGLLAHGVQRAARLAHALRQPGGTTHHLDVVVEGNVQLLLGVTPRRAIEAGRTDHGVDAIFGQLLDVEPARHEHRARRTARHVHARRGVQRPLEGANALPPHLGLRHHAHRLRRLARRQRQARGGAHGRRREGGFAVHFQAGLARHHHGAQLESLIDGGMGSPGQRGQRQCHGGRTKQAGRRRGRTTADRRMTAHELFLAEGGRVVCNVFPER